MIVCVCVCVHVQLGDSVSLTALPVLPQVPLEALDYPDTRAGHTDLLRRLASEEALWARRPPGKRVPFETVGLTSGHFLPPHTLRVMCITRGVARVTHQASLPGSCAATLAGRV